MLEIWASNPTRAMAKDLKKYKFTAIMKSPDNLSDPFYPRSSGRLPCRHSCTYGSNIRLPGHKEYLNLSLLSYFNPSFFFNFVKREICYIGR